MSVNSKANRQKRLNSDRLVKRKILAAQNKGREDGLAGRPDMTIKTLYIVSQQLSKINYAYRSARDKAIMGQ